MELGELWRLPFFLTLKRVMDRRKKSTVCKMCGEVIEGRTAAQRTSRLMRHIQTYHTYSETDLEVLDAMEDMLPGNREFARVVGKAKRKMVEVMELQRMWRLPDRRGKRK